MLMVYFKKSITVLTLLLTSSLIFSVSAAQVTLSAGENGTIGNVYPFGLLKINSAQSISCWGYLMSDSSVVLIDTDSVEYPCTNPLAFTGEIVLMAVKIIHEPNSTGDVRIDVNGNTVRAVSIKSSTAVAPCSATLETEVDMGIMSRKEPVSKKVLVAKSDNSSVILIPTNEGVMGDGVTWTLSSGRYTGLDMDSTVVVTASNEAKGGTYSGTGQFYLNCL